MTTHNWPTDQLNKISKADDLKISPFRDDGKTYGTPTWIWNVAVGGELFVRAYNGEKSRWYQAAMQQKGGQIHTAGMVTEVSFEPVTDDLINKQIDEAYKEKYKSSAYLNPMIGDKAKAATVRIVLK